MTNPFRKPVTQLIGIIFEAVEFNNSSFYTMLKGFTADKLADLMESKLEKDLQISSSELYAELNKLSKGWTQHLLSDILKLRKVAVGLGDQESKLLLILFLAALTSAILSPQVSHPSREEASYVR